MTAAVIPFTAIVCLRSLNGTPTIFCRVNSPGLCEPVMQMTFGEAVEHIQVGGQCASANWNENGMHIYIEYGVISGETL
ncbi:hypothetical protein V4841_12330 [Lelliottia amnigena]|uniref:hypothetical protein n=1 Tax=Lelliottia amnigena TaxID=61646 RepID=UPI002F3FB2F6